jgi:hypothetical protein
MWQEDENKKSNINNCYLEAAARREFWREFSPSHSLRQTPFLRMKTSKESEQSKSKTNRLDYFGRVILFVISAASLSLKPKAIRRSFS